MIARNTFTRVTDNTSWKMWEMIELFKIRAVSFMKKYEERLIMYTFNYVTEKTNYSWKIK